MKIAVIGTGNVGSALATAWMRAGHEVFAGVRDINSEKARSFSGSTSVELLPIQLAVEKSDVILLAIPSTAVPDLAKELGSLRGKVIIDSTNSVFRHPEPWKNAYEALSDLTQATIIKCFNSTGAENMRDPWYQINDIRTNADMFLAGDDEQGMQIATSLAEDAGFRAIRFGNSSSVPLLEEMCRIWIHLSMNGMGRQFAFKVLDR